MGFDFIPPPPSLFLNSGMQHTHTYLSIYRCFLDGNIFKHIESCHNITKLESAGSLEDPVIGKCGGLVD